MTDLTEKRINIQQEEVDNNSVVSEETISRMGQSVNFINKRQYDTHSFHFNGLVGNLKDFNNQDGVFPCLFSMKIVGVFLFVGKSGISGTNEIDIEWFSVSGTNNGSIFSTTPKLTASASDNAYLYKRLTDDIDLSDPAGATLPVLSKTEFSAGNVLRAKILNNSSGAEDAQITIQFIPR